MYRCNDSPRENWKEEVSQTGLTFHTNPDGTTFWDESAHYRFLPSTASQIRTASEELHRLCLLAIEAVLKSDELLTLFRIPPAAWPLLRTSWERDPRAYLYGRFDLALQPGDTPRMFEYNADTPTTVVESSVALAQWLAQVHPEASPSLQMNRLRQLLTARWKSLAPAGASIHFACVRDSEEDFKTVDLLRQTAHEAGFTTFFLFVDEIGWDEPRGTFVDVDNKPLQMLFKLYPWEWMFSEEFGAAVGRSATRFIEPPWKLILSSKSLMPLLWRMFPGHPNLLPAYWSEAEALADPRIRAAGFVRKPIFGREGANVTLTRPDAAPVVTEGDYGDEGFIWQQTCVAPYFDGRYTIIGSWMVGPQHAGIVVREDKSPVIRNLSMIVPHLVSEDVPAEAVVATRAPVTDPPALNAALSAARFATRAMQHVTPCFAGVLAATAVRVPEEIVARLRRTRDGGIQRWWCGEGIFAATPSPKCWLAVRACLDAPDDAALRPWWRCRELTGADVERRLFGPPVWYTSRLGLPAYTLTLCLPPPPLANPVVIKARVARFLGGRDPRRCLGGVVAALVYW